MAQQAEISTGPMAPVTGLPVRSAADSGKDIMIAGAMFAAAFILYFVPAIMLRPLHEPGELRIGVMAREMIQDGNYTVPKLAGKPKLVKPPLSYWFATSAARIMGGTQASAERVMTRAVELPSALLTAATVFLVVLYGCAAFGRVAGVTAGLMLATFAMSAECGRMGFTDAGQMFFCAGAYCASAWIVCTQSPGILPAVALGLCVGLGLLNDWILPLPLIFAVLLVETLIRREFNLRKVLLFSLAFFIAAVVFGIWLIALKQQLPTAFDEIKESISDAYTVSGHTPGDRWFFYFNRLAGGLLPWTPLLLAAWPLYYFRVVRDETGESPASLRLSRQHFQFFCLSALLGFTCFYICPRQSGTFLLPLLPPIALASGYILSRMRSPGGRAEECLAWTQICVGIIAGILISSLPAWPELLKNFDGEFAKHFTSGVKSAVDMTGPVVLIGAGLVIVFMHFFLARQWVEARPLKGAVILAVAAYAALMVWGVVWTIKLRQNAPLANEGTHLRKDLGSLSKDTSIYATGIPTSKIALMYYLQRPVSTVDDLAQEPTGRLGGEAPSRAMVLPADQAKSLQMDQDLLPPSKDAILVISLPKDVDWPKWAQEHIHR